MLTSRRNGHPGIQLRLKPVFDSIYTCIDSWRFTDQRTHVLLKPTVIRNISIECPGKKVLARFSLTRQYPDQSIPNQHKPELTEASPKRIDVDTHHTAYCGPGKR